MLIKYTYPTEGFPIVTMAKGDNARMECMVKAAELLAKRVMK